MLTMAHLWSILHTGPSIDHLFRQTLRYSGSLFRQRGTMCNQKVLDLYKESSVIRFLPSPGVKVFAEQLGKSKHNAMVSQIYIILI